MSVRSLCGTERQLHMKGRGSLNIDQENYQNDGNNKKILQTILRFFGENSTFDIITCFRFCKRELAKLSAANYKTHYSLHSYLGIFHRKVLEFTRS